MNSPTFAKATAGRPRGIRNHNPGNIRKSRDRWRGLAGEQSDPEFFTFVAALWGLRALAIVLRNYQRKHGLNTVAAIIGRWAPASENDTGAYARAVAAALGQRMDARLDLDDRRTLRLLVEAIVRHENGMQPYDRAVIEAALTLAGLPSVASAEEGQSTERS